MSSTLQNNVRSPDSQIFLHKQRILESVMLNQVVIIVGQTGCGKSTQIPQYLYQNGFSKNGMIACLHPRCIAAMSLAERVSLETRTKLGLLVGYSVRFYSQYQRESTKILYMTTGYMMRMLSGDLDKINEFSVVIIDEAHERTVQNDLLMGTMKMIMDTNKFLKLVIMSATLEVSEFQDYFPNSVTVMIREVSTKVEVIYRPPESGTSYMNIIQRLVAEILDSSNTGHILIFLPSEEKVRRCKNLLKEFKRPVVLSFYSAMDNDDKMMVFQEFGRRRKIIVATNVAETSLTIAGVDFVIDSGYVKRVYYDQEKMVEKWVTERVSIAEADQRKGRTGRTGPGKCYRLYEDPEEATSKETQFYPSLLLALMQAMKNMEKRIHPEFPDPEMKRTNLGSVILTLKVMGVRDLGTFPFIVRPDPKVVTAAITHLEELSLLNKDGSLTTLGREVADLPLDPALGKVASIAARIPSCRQEVFSIIALSSVINVFKNPSGKLSQAAHQKFQSPHGDLFSLLNVYQAASKNGFRKEWCKENFINFSCLKYASMILAQLQQMLPHSNKRDADMSRSIENRIKKAFLSGFFHNISYPKDGVYKTVSGKSVALHKGSCVKPDSDDLVLGTVVLTSDKCKDHILRNCIILNRDMLEAFDPPKYKIKVKLWTEITKKIDEK